MPRITRRSPVTWQLLTIMETENHSGRSILRGIGRATRETHDCDFQFLRLDLTLDRLWIEELSTWKNGAVIANIGDPRMSKGLLEAGVPVVRVYDEPYNDSFPSVTLDNEAIGRVAAKHLLELGYRRLGFAGTNMGRWIAGRLRGFSQAAKEAGVSVDSYLPPDWPNHPWADSPVRKNMREWLVGLKKPVGIFGANDSWSAAVLHECGRAGIAVPEQVAIVGADNDDLICGMSPALSSVIANHFQVGYEAAILARKLAHGGKAPDAPIVVQPRGVFVRASSDSVAVDDPNVSLALEFIRLHACEGIQVDDVVAAVPVSRSVLQRRFQSALGRSIHDQIVEARIKRAKELLAGTDLPIPLVAERSGITPQPYLNVVFKSRVGQSPARYRKEMQFAGDTEGPT